MEQMPEFRTRTSRLPMFVFLLCLLQPCMDVLSYWLDATGTGNSLTTLLRFGVLAVTILLGFLVSHRKKYYFGLAAILLLLTAGHVWAISKDGIQSLTIDLGNLLRIYFLPLNTIAFISFIRRDPACMTAFRRGIFWALILMAVVELLSVVTGTNPYSYPNKSIGILGWFYFANSQSAILSMAAPIAICYVMEKRQFRWLPTLFISVVSLAVLYCLATRLAYATAVGVGLGISVCLLLLKKTAGLRSGAAGWIVLGCTLLVLVGYSVSPMAENNRQVEANRILKQQDIDQRVSADEAAAVSRGLTGEALQEARLRSAYEEYIPGPTGYFGLSRTAKLYGYSTDVDQVADIRLMRLRFNQMLLEDSHPACAWFGLEREDIVHDGITYDVENDFHGIYYLCGGISLGLLLVFLGWFLLRILIALLRNFKRTFTLEAVGCGLALVCGLAHAYFTAGVLRRPNATFYLAVVLAAVYGLTAGKMTREVSE